jgi:hypothetical protein
VDQENWVKEFSQYDAGWLHFFKSENMGEIKRSNWDDLNIPARMATLALAGIPMLQRDNAEHIVATQSLVKKLDVGLLFTDMEELGQMMRNRERMLQLRENTWKQRELFMFDHHVEDLVDFFRKVISSFKSKQNKASDNISPTYPAIHERAAADKTYYAQHPHPLN